MKSVPINRDHHWQYDPKYSAFLKKKHGGFYSHLIIDADSD